MPDISQGKITPVNPGVITRAAQAARWLISGVSPSTWFGPGVPIPPVAPPEVKGRTWDYPSSVNTNYNPRSYEVIKFDDLRALADNCDILRSVIETRKDQMEALTWNIRVKLDPDDKRRNATTDQKKRIDAITDFLQYPDKNLNFSQWQRALLEDMFVLDAVAIYKWPNRVGGLYGLKLIDGATISPLIREDGLYPFGDEPAYREILKGVPAAEYSRNEMIYYRSNPRTNKLYGYSKVEQVILTVNTLIRRALHQLEYYREGSTPDSFVGLPKEWTTDQIIAFQKNFDAMMSGNLASRRKVKFMPGEFKYEQTKPLQLKDEYDEWLARIICYVFSVPPTPFIKQMNRSTAENQHEMALQEGLAPLQRTICGLLNQIITTDFDSPDLEFIFLDDREQDPKQASEIDVAYVGAGIMTIDEIREKRGLEPVGGAAAQNMVKTATGYVPVQTENTPDDETPPAEGHHDRENADVTENATEKTVYARLRKAGGKKPVPFRVQKHRRPLNHSRTS